MSNGIYAAILAISEELPPIPKKKKGESGLKFDAYVTEDIVKVLKPKLHQHRVFVVSRGVERSTDYSEVNGKPVAHHYVFMNHVFYHQDGSCVETSSFGEGTGYNDEGLAKAHTRSLGAALREIFLIADEGNSARPPAEGRENRPQTDMQRYWDRVRELRLTDGSQVLTAYGKDPVKALDHINKRQQEAVGTVMAEHKPQQPESASPPAPEPVAPAPVANHSDTTPHGRAIQELKTAVRGKIITKSNADDVGHFWKGLLGCQPDKASWQSLQSAKLRIEAALKIGALVEWVGATWNCSQPLQLECTGLIIAYLAGNDWSEFMKIVGTRVPPAKDAKGVKTLADNLRGFVREEAEA